MNLREQIPNEILKSAPPVSIAGLTGSEILIGISILYVVLQIAHLAWKWAKERESAAFERSLRKPEGDKDDGK